MKFRSRSLLVAAVGLWLTHPAPGQEPAPIRLERGSTLETAVQMTENQRMADLIAGKLQNSRKLTKFAIDVSYLDGVADLSGNVADEAQKDEALTIVRTMPGIVRVVDNILVNGITPVQARMTPVAQAPVPTLPPTAPPRPIAPPLAQAPTPAPSYAPPLAQAPTNMLPPSIGAPSGPAYGMQPPAAPGIGGGSYTAQPPAYAGGPSGMMMEPTPINQMAPPSPYDLNPPQMPPHAWPTYAPYNNYSRVAYPTQYPYQAWPFIGPFYPFPKVPLGWRSVKLEWEDGHWWYKKCATQHDFWRIRYW